MASVRDQGQTTPLGFFYGNLGDGFGLGSMEVTQVTVDYDMSCYLVEWSYQEFPRWYAAHHVQI